MSTVNESSSAPAAESRPTVSEGTGDHALNSDHTQPGGQTEKKRDKQPAKRFTRVAELMSNPMSIAIMVVWAISCEGALSLNILADVFQSEAPAFPLIPTIATSIGLNIFCAILTALLGRRTLRYFQLYQPFAGGQAFIVIQGFGYGILVVTSALFIMYLEAMHSEPGKYRYGTLTVLGCFSTLADILLMTSLLFFVHDRQRHHHHHHHHRNNTSTLVKDDKAVWWRNLSASPNGEIALVVCFCFVILGCSSMAEYYPAVRRSVVIIDTIFLLLGILTIHLVIGYNYTPGYRLFMPNTGNLRMRLMQAFSWFLAFVTLQFNLILYKTDVSSPASWHILGGLSSVISICTLLLFVCMHRFHPSAQSETSLLGEYGPLMFTLVSSFQAASVWCVVLVLSSEQFILDLKLRQGLIMCQTLSSLLCFALPPCTHLLGRIAFGREYEVWSPFKGPRGFLILQSAGWTCFAFAIFFATLQITEDRHFRFAIIQSSLSALSQGFIHASLYFFAESRKGALASKRFQSSSFLSNPFSTGTDAENSLEVDGASPTNCLCDDEEASLLEADRSLVTTVLNGEMIMAILLWTIGFLIRVVTDVAAGSRNELDDFLHIPTSSLLRLANVISFIVVPLAHASCRKRISLFAPFVGCGEYVAMQSIGWALYAVNLLIAIANSFLGKQSLILPIMVDQYVFLGYTMESLIMAIPLVCVIMGSFFETNAQNLKISLQERSRLDVLELFHVLQRAIPEGEELRQAETLLKNIAGPRWQEPPATDGSLPIREDEEAARLRQEAAKHIVTLLSVAGLLAFMSAAFLAERQPVFTLIFGIAGVALTTVSCFSIHYFYGGFLHRASGRYSFFMPFSGGSTFVTLQAIGWGSYASSLLLIAMSCAEVRGSAVVFATAGVLSVCAQCSILCSVPRFDPALQPKSLLERNAEGILALLALIGSFTFSMVYDMYMHGGTSKTASSMLPITFSAVSMCFAIPLGLVSLKRQSYSMNFSPFSMFETTLDLSESEDFSDEIMEHKDSLTESLNLTVLQEPTTPFIEGGAQKSTAPSVSQMMDMSLNSDTVTSFGTESFVLSRRRGLRTPLHVMFFMIPSIVAIFLTLLLPFAFVYVAYCSIYSGLHTLRIVFNSFYTLLGVFALAVLVPMFFAPTARTKAERSTIRNIYNTICCFTIYSIPTIVAGITFSPLLLIRTTGSWILVGNMVVLSCISTVPYIQGITMLANVCFMGYLLHYHIYFCLVERYADFHAWNFVTDMTLTIFWVLYFRRYVGRPHITGRLINSSIRKFCKEWIFRGIEGYFNLRIAVDGRTGEKVDGPCVDMRDPGNKYLFAFHPHGVFTGTALWIPIGRLWEKSVGHNDVHIVTTHCADVVFSVPFMRDAVMSVGAMSVSRRGIESSLLQGNSPLIVTGGQAEMILTKISDTEMHLVTHHRGFVRLALLQRVPLVPVICFAEQNIWGNIYLPQIQRYTLKIFGFPLPVFPYGRWYLPLPTKRPLMVVVGRPILPEAGMDSADSAENVERYRQRYFEHVTKLFMKYRAEAGYPNMSLVLHHHHEVTRIDKA